MAAILQFTVSGLEYAAEVSDGIASVLETRLLPTRPMNYDEVTSFLHDLIDLCRLPEMPEENAAWTAAALGCLSQIRRVTRCRLTEPIVLMSVIP